MASAVVTAPVADIAAITDPVYAYKSDNGFFAAEFASAIGTANAVNFTRNGYAFGWKPDNVVYVDNAGNMDVVFGVNQNASAQVYKNRVTYVGTSQITSDEFDCNNNELKHSVRMVAPPRIPAGYMGTPTQMASGGTITYDSRLSIFADGKTQTTDFEVMGDIGFKDVDGNLIYKLPMITAIDADGNTVQGTYKVTFNVDGTISFYGMVSWSWLQYAAYPVVIDPTVVVSSVYDTSGNGGRKIVRLSDNSIVVMYWNSTNTQLGWYRSTDNGTTWSLLTYSNALSGTYYGSAMCSNGTMVYAILSQGASAYMFAFDATNVAKGISATATIDTQSSMNNAPTIAVDSTGALHAAWSSVNQTYPYSYNIRYSKSTNGGSTWATPTQVTTTNLTNADNKNPCIILRSNNYPTIVYQYGGTAVSTPTIAANTWNGSAFGTQVVVYNIQGSSYAQSEPCVAVDSNDVIHVVWQGIDATYSNAQIKYSKSTDGGTTWSAMVNLTTISAYSQTNPSITADPSNNLYVYLQGIDSSYSTTYSALRIIKCTGGTWGSVSTVYSAAGNQTNVQSLWSKFNMNSSDAIRYIWEDSTGSVDYDTITLNSPPNAPTLNAHANFDATVAQTLTWQFSDPDAGNTQSAYQLQIVDASTSTTVIDTGKVASTTSSYSLAANALSNGKSYQWRVTTWDQSGAQGPYSSYSTFSTAAAPSVSVTSPSNNATIKTSSITVQFSYSDPASNAQQSYQVQLLDSAEGKILADSGTISGTNNQYTIQYKLVNLTTYHVKVRATNSQNVTSAWTNNTFSTSFTAAQPPSVTATPLSASAKVTIVMTNFVTTNLIENSDFETVTGTATVFSDALTSYTGSSAAPWTVQEGTVSYGASGVTFTAVPALITTGNAAWKPLTGSGGQNLAQTVKASLEMPSSMANIFVELFQDINHRYRASFDGSTLHIYKTTTGDGGFTQLASSAYAGAVSTTYEIQLSLDSAGKLIATLFNSSGTQLQTCNATDGSPLTGGFLMGMGCSSVANVIGSNSSVAAPFADAWTIGGDSRVAWALTSTNSISGKYSVSAVGVSNVTGYIYQNTSISTSTDYTVSFEAQSQNVGPNGFQITANLNGTLADNPVVSGTTSTTRYSATALSGSTSGTQNVTLALYDSGTVTFDDIQLETGSSATPYVRNDSTSGSVTTPNVAYNRIYKQVGGQWQLAYDNVNASSYDDYLVGNGVSIAYGISAMGSNGVESAITSVSATPTFIGDWVYDPTTGNQFQFLYNRAAYDMATQEERKEYQTFGSKPMIRRGPLNARQGTLDALMVKTDSSQTPIQQLQAFESDLGQHNACYLKTAAGEVFKVDLHGYKRKMPVEYLNVQAIGCSVDWTEVA